MALACMAGTGAPVTPSPASELEAPTAEAAAPVLETGRALADVAQQTGMPAFDAGDPEAVVALLIQHGCQAQLDPGSDTRAWIRTQVQGRATRVTVFIRMSGCTEATGCQHLILSTGFFPPGEADPAPVRSYDRQRAVGAAHIDDGGACWVRHCVPVAFVRDTGQMLALVRLWRGVTVEFAGHVGVEI